MSTIILYPYQINLIERLYQAWDEGARNVLLQLATGGGKSIILSEVIKKHTSNSIIIAHRSELVAQLCLILARCAIPHHIIASKTTIREIISVQMSTYKKSYYQVGAKCIVASVDTLVKYDNTQFKNISLVVQDEAHHVLKNNKWGTVGAFFPNARGLYLTATPRRADGRGLGRHADGVIDHLIEGPPMHTLIQAGFLSRYRIFAPRCDVDLDNVPLSNSGDYSPQHLRTAVHKSKIIGDVIKHYLQFAPGKLGITFATDVDHAERICALYNQHEIRAEVISAKTHDLKRSQVMRRFRNREILQLVNVDILGEGVDIPAVEVVTFARPTKSFALYCQQFGRALRINPNNTTQRALIIDHVDNVRRLGLPDSPQVWSLDNKARKNNTTSTIKLKTCVNLNCFAVYESFHNVCPYCGLCAPPFLRSSPEEVEGDLVELDPRVLSKLRDDIQRIDNAPMPPSHLNRIAQLSYIKKHTARQEAQHELRACIAQWAGYYKALDKPDEEIHRRFFYEFNIDVLTAQTLSTKDANILKEKINNFITSQKTTFFS